MRVAAVPAPLASSPGSTIVVAIELAGKDAVEAEKIDFNVMAIDANGKVRARQRFANSFTATGSTASGWTRFRTHLGVAPGQYQVRVAAVGANKTQGSVFTEVTVTKFDSELALGGLSLVSPTPGAAVNAKQMAEVVALTPYAARDVPPNTALAAEMPIRVAAKSASTPLTMTATLVSARGESRQLEQGAHAAADYAKPMGHVYRVALPGDLAEGDYRLVVEAMSGRARGTRELAFRIVAP